MRLLSRLGAAVLSIAVIVPATQAQERVVTLGASVTEIVFALGAGDRVVARDSSSLFPQAAAGLPDVGYFRTIGAEGIFSMEPDLILAAHGSGPESQVEILKNSGIPFVHLDDEPTSASVLENIRQIGERLGRQQAAKELRQTLKSQFAEANRIAGKSESKPNVVFLIDISGNATRAAYDDTAATAIIELAGGMNPFHGYSGYKETSPEEIYAIDPDVILVSSRAHGASEPLDFDNPPEWIKSTRAWQSENVIRIDMAYYLVFGPRIGQASIDLAKLIHREPDPQS